MTPQGKGGGPESSEVARKLVELLERGGEQGVDKETVIREVGKVIPPGRAIRQAERARRKAAGVERGTVPEQRARPVSDDRLIQYGRRALVVAAFHTMKANIERYKDADGVEWVRLLSVPPAVARDRARARAHHQFDEVDIADELRDGAPASALLGELTPAQLMRVALELARRERERATMAPDSTAHSEERSKWPNV